MRCLEFRIQSNFGYCMSVLFFFCPGRQHNGVRMKTTPHMMKFSIIVFVSCGHMDLCILKQVSQLQEYHVSGLTPLKALNMKYVLLFGN